MNTNTSRARHFVELACASAAAVITTLAVLLALGWARPAAPHSSASSRAARTPHNLLFAAGLLGAPAITANPAEAGSAFTAVADYTAAGSYTFTVPAGITTLLVQFYGAGGGGGEGSTLRGGGGGAGAYVMSVVSVTPGDTYTIDVGEGGAGGTNGQAGGNGGDTSIIDPSGNVIVAAGGGAGGQPTGVTGAGGVPIGGPQIGRNGTAGGQEHSAYLGGRGYSLPAFPVPNALLPYDGNVGGGGDGNSYKGERTTPGQVGYAFIAY
jgi:Glycine-rich domain